MNKNFQSRNQSNEPISKAKSFWMHVGFVALAIALAVVTVFVLNLNV